MRAEIISVGTELLLGDIVNTNAQFLSQELAALGYTVFYQTTVGDNSMRLRTLVQEAKARSEILIFTGGLGPTDDDLTKQTVADAFGDTLYLDDEELTRMERFFIGTGRKMTDNNIKQALVPRAGRKLPNDNGTAPGAFFRQADRMAFLLPGPPAEMKPMFMQQVQPVLAAMQDSAIRSLTLHVTGIGESELEEKTKTLLNSDNPSAALYAKSGEIHIRITAKSSRAAQADEMCFEYADLFRKILGDYIYSDNGDNLETTVVNLLMENEESIATAESCTGGLLSERLTSVSGASAVFGFGTCTYANEFKRGILGVKRRTLKRHGAVSSQVAAEMAYGAAKKGNADYGVGITGIAGPEGGTDEKPVGLVYVAASSGRHVYIKKVLATGHSRPYVRTLATQHALDTIRRLSDGLPIPEAKHFTKTQDPDFDRVTRPRRRGDTIVRAVLSFIAILAVLAAIFVGIYFVRGMLRPKETPNSLSALGYTYGTSEYSAAAVTLVQTAQTENPIATGYIALPGGKLEQLVLRSTISQEKMQAATQPPDTVGRTIIAPDANPTRPSSNTLIIGGNSFSSLANYQSPDNISEISTFRYYTAQAEQIYRVFSVYLLDKEDLTSFNPAILQLDDYQSFLDFSFALKSRSLYELPVELAEDDRFMTLTIPLPTQPTRSIYLCGRLLRPNETLPTTNTIVSSGNAIMPVGWYRKQNLAPPSATSVYRTQLLTYISGGMANSDLQLRAKMPSIDLGPYIYPALPPAPSSSSETSSSLLEDEASKSESSISLSSSSSSSASSSAASAAGAAANSSSIPVSESVEASSSSKSKPPVQPTPLPVRANPGLLTVTMNGEVLTDSTTNILAQICQAEPIGSHPEAIKAQAIAAHTWILNQQGAGNAAPTVVGRPPSSAIVQAVSEVASTVLTTGKEMPGFTTWHFMAAKQTNSAENIWGIYRPYLTSVSSPQDANRIDWTGFVTLSTEEVAALVLQNTGIDLTAISAPELWFENLQYDESGYLSNITFNDTEISGIKFWQDVLAKNGKPLLKSPAFEVSFRGNGFMFTTYGDGHGCGMSQTGAAALAQSGETYENILIHYYPSTILAKWV